MSIVHAKRQRSLDKMPSTGGDSNSHDSNESLHCDVTCCALLPGSSNSWWLNRPRTDGARRTGRQDAGCERICCLYWISVRICCCHCDCEWIRWLCSSRSGSWSLSCCESRSKCLHVWWNDTIRLCKDSSRPRWVAIVICRGIDKSRRYNDIISCAS